MATNDIYEVVLRGQVAGVGASYNVFHVRDEGGSHAIADVAQAILDTWVAEFTGSIPTALSWSEATYAKISPAPAGPQITVAVTKAGAATGQFVPQCAAVTKWITATGGRSGRGRSYAGPLAEVVLESGYLLAASRDDFQSGADAMVAKYGVGGSSSGDFTFGVWSRKLGLYYPITAAAARSIVYTQRRRIPGRGI